MQSLSGEVGTNRYPVRLLGFWDFPMEKRAHIKTQRGSATNVFRKRKGRSLRALQLTAKAQHGNASIAEIIDTLQERRMIVFEGEITFNVGRPIKAVIRFKSRESLVYKIKTYIPSNSLPRIFEWLAGFLVRITAK